MKIKVPHVLYCYASVALLAVGAGFAEPREASLGVVTGQVVEDVTGKGVSEFWIQEGVADLQNPREISWKQLFLGSHRESEGFFTVQARKPGQVWRVVANGYSPQVILDQPILAPIGPTNQVVRLKRAGDLHGTVYDHQNQPAPGVGLFLVGEGMRLSLEDGKSRLPFAGSCTITDSEGRFAISGVSGARQKLVIVSPGGFPVGVAPEVEPGQQLRITMPELATLIVRYDIPADTPQASFRLQLRSVDLPSMQGGEYVRHFTVTNQGQVVLTGLWSGTYGLARTKTLGGFSRSYFYCRSNVVVGAGQSQHVNYVRSAGFPVRGQAVLPGGKAASCASVLVRSADATGRANNLKEWRLPMYDVVSCDETGQFSTARLEPGTYTIVVEMFSIETFPPWGEVIDTSIPVREWGGVAKLTVNADAAPLPLSIVLNRETRGE